MGLNKRKRGGRDGRDNSKCAWKLQILQRGKSDGLGRNAPVCHEYPVSRTTSEYIYVMHPRKLRACAEARQAVARRGEAPLVGHIFSALLLVQAELSCGNKEVRSARMSVSAGGEGRFHRQPATAINDPRIITVRFAYLGLP